MPRKGEEMLHFHYMAVSQHKINPAQGVMKFTILVIITEYEIYLIYACV